MKVGKEITAEWTGKWPCLCFGEWIIKINGREIELPEEKRTSPMHTFGTYASWSFNAGWSEEWSNYEDGLTFEPWLEDNAWVGDLDLTPDEQRQLYDAINACDWRHGSCGGCI